MIDARSRALHCSSSGGTIILSGPGQETRRSPCLIPWAEPGRVGWPGRPLLLTSRRSRCVYEAAEWTVRAWVGVPGYLTLSLERSASGKLQAHVPLIPSVIFYMDSSFGMHTRESICFVLSCTRTCPHKTRPAFFRFMFVCLFDSTNWISDTVACYTELKFRCRREKEMLRCSSS